MGRRDAVQVTLEVIARMRQILPALIVSYEPGWETRGNGTSADYEGALVHHTASPSSLVRPFPTQNLLRVGRPDLPGPLCNEAGPACTVATPRIHVMSANPANHAGASGGRSMGPLPVTSLFNKRVRGLEIDYAGSVEMLAGQLLVAHVWARANADVVGGGDIQRIRAHFETSVTGKWDIGAGAHSVDMPQFRREAAAIASRATPAPPAAPTIQEDDVPTLYLQPGQARSLPATTKSSDLLIACDNPTRDTVKLAGPDGPDTLIEGADLRIAVQRADRTWHPVARPGFPINAADPFTTAVPLGTTGTWLSGDKTDPGHGQVLGISVRNTGHLPVTVTLAPHPA